MKSFLHILSNLSMFTFILTSLFGAGLGLTIKEIIAPLKKFRMVAFALLANFVLIPAFAYCLSVLFKADPGLNAGLIIIACCAGAPFLPKLVSTAKGSVAGAIGLMVLLMIVTVGYLPIALPLIIPGLAVDPWSIAKPLLFFMLLPLFLGLLIKALKPKLAGQTKPLMEKVASLSLITTGILVLLIDLKLLVSAWGTGVYNLSFLFTVGAITIGYILGGTNRSVLALGSGARNIAAALLIAATNFEDPRVVTVVLIGSLVQFIALFSFAFIQGKLRGS